MFSVCFCGPEPGLRASKTDRQLAAGLYAPISRIDWILHVVLSIVINVAQSQVNVARPPVRLPPGRGAQAQGVGGFLVVDGWPPITPLRVVSIVSWAGDSRGETRDLEATAKALAELRER